MSCPVSRLSQGSFPAAGGSEVLRLGRKAPFLPAAASLPLCTAGHQQRQVWQVSEAIVCTQRDYVGASHHEGETG